jgi:quercetin dioxygenase-like cupin family protein
MTYPRPRIGAVTENCIVYSSSIRVLKMSRVRNKRALLALFLAGCVRAAVVKSEPPRTSTTIQHLTMSRESVAIAPAIQRTLLQQRDVPELPGWETRIYLIQYGPGIEAPLHHHPVEGLGYVVSGRFESAFENEAPALVHEGESFVDRAAAPHTLFRNADATRPLTFLLAYTVLKDAPVVVTP